MERIHALNLTPEGDHINLETNVIGMQNETLTCKPELFCTVLNYLKIYHGLMLQDKLVYDSVVHSLGLEESRSFSLGHLILDISPGYEKNSLQNLSRSERAIYATLPYAAIQELGRLALNGFPEELVDEHAVTEICVLVTPIPFDELIPGGPVVRCSVDLRPTASLVIAEYNYFAGNILNLIEEMQKCGAWLTKDIDKKDVAEHLYNREKPFISALPPEIHMREFPCVTVEFESFLRSLKAKGIYGTVEDINLLKGYAPELENICHTCEISSELIGDMFVKDFMKAMGETNEEATTDDLYFESEWSARYKELILAMAFPDIPIDYLGVRGDVKEKDSLFALFGKIPKSRLLDINIYGYMIIGPAVPILFTSAGVVIGDNPTSLSTENFYRVVLYKDFTKYLREELALDLSGDEIPEDSPFKLLNNAFDFSNAPSLQLSNNLLTIPDTVSKTVGGMYNGWPVDGTIGDMCRAWLHSELSSLTQSFNVKYDYNSGLKLYPILHQSIHWLLSYGHDGSFRTEHSESFVTLPQLVAGKIFMDCWVGKQVDKFWLEFVTRMYLAYKESVVPAESWNVKRLFGVAAWNLLYTLAVLNTKYDLVVWTKYKDLDDFLSGNFK